LTATGRQADSPVADHARPRREDVFRGMFIDTFVGPRSKWYVVGDIVFLIVGVWALYALPRADRWPSNAMLSFAVWVAFRLGILVRDQRRLGRDALTVAAAVAGWFAAIAAVLGLLVLGSFALGTPEGRIQFESIPVWIPALFLIGIAWYSVVKLFRST
jgi:hypothetical protein